MDPAEDNAKVQQTINEWAEAKRVTTKPEVAQGNTPEMVVPLALAEEVPSVQEIANPIQEEPNLTTAPVEQSGYSAVMERIWKENEAKREATSDKGSIENLALEPRIPEYTKPEEVLSTPVGETGPHLVVPRTTEQGPITVEGSFTRVPEGQEIEPVLTPEQIKQAKLEKIRAKLDVMTGVVEARAEKAGMVDKVRKVGEMWNKVPKRYKYMLAGGALLSGVGAAAAGSAVAVGAIGALGTALRGLSGAGLFVTFEAILKNAHEKKTGGERSKAIEARHMLLASLGAVAFAALLPKMISDYVGSEAIQTGTQEAGGAIVETPAQVVPKIEYVVGQGGTLWGGITEQLNTQGTFAGMQEGQKTYIIDALKDKFAAMSPAELKAIGITSGSIDVIHPGDHIDLTKVLGDAQLMPDIVRHAEALTPGQIYSIEHPTVAHPITGVTPEVSVPAPETTTTTVMPQEIAPIDPAIITAADDIVTNYVDENFGTKGFLGFGAQHGVDSIDWKDAEVGFANQSVDDVMSVHPSAFPNDGVRHFGVEDYSATQKMQAGLLEVQKETGINSRPAETVVDYLKRAAVTTLSGQSAAESVTQRT